MATTNILDDFLVKNNLEFQSFYKELMNEMIDVNELGDVLINSLKKSINSTRFWSKKLEKFTNAKTIIFTTFSPEPFKRVAFMDIFQALGNVIDLNSVKEIYQPENPRYIGIILESEEKANFVLENFKKVGTAFIIFTSWLAEAQVYKGRVHWLPNHMDLKLIYEFLDKYFVIKSVSKAETLIAKDLIINTNVIIFEGLLKFGVNLSDVPHLRKFNNDDALITIKGRPPLCLGCNRIGHTKANCEYAHCIRCKVICLKSHDCQDFVLKESYADILKTTDNCGETSVSTLNASVSSSKVLDLGTDKLDNNWISVRRSNAKSAFKVKRPSLLIANEVSSVLRTLTPVQEPSDSWSLSNIESVSMEQETIDGRLDEAGVLKRRRHEGDSAQEGVKKMGECILGKEEIDVSIETMNKYDILCDESYGTEL